MLQFFLWCYLCGSHHNKNLIIRFNVSTVNFFISDPLAQFDNVIPQPIFGPSLLINGHSATWEGSYNVCNQHVVGLSVRLLFDAMIGESATSCIDITNNGTTAMHYLWTV